MKTLFIVLALLQKTQSFRFGPNYMNIGRRALVTSISTTKEVNNIVASSSSSSSSSRFFMSTTESMYGSTLKDDALLKEALQKFMDDASLVDKVTAEPTVGGVNNINQFVTMPDGRRCMLRIYNNGLDTKRVTFEHGILKQLNNKEVFKLSFEVPMFLPSPITGQTFVSLSSGAEACMCKIIPGGLPKLTCVEDIGRASGELNTEIAKVNINKELCNSAPYYEMFKVHHAVTKDNFVETMESSLFDETREYSTKMTKAVLDIKSKCEGAYQNLPTQLIHGDLHYDNVLVLDEKVTGLLDFEFAAFDWRAMELAICLSKYAGEPNPMEYFTSFIKGYSKTGILNDQEIDALPDLINLRILSNVVYFVGRYIAKEDGIESLTSRIKTYWNRIQWINDNAESIRDQIRSGMKQ